MGCFLSAAKGEPIKAHGWLTVHWPDPLEDLRSVIVASSKNNDTKTLHSLLDKASTNLENLLNDVTARGGQRVSQSTLGMLVSAIRRGTRPPTQHKLSFKDIGQ